MATRIQHRNQREVSLRAIAAFPKANISRAESVEHQIATLQRHIVRGRDLIRNRQCL